ncbi:MAG: TadE/TadG family type IV pilus assembly protein [Brevundimonas sp.]|uniref:TadE/TadG family type IV pilus assembly protein n=1 Tax=Brevundimonas sp. TaxID=1871086 RepID=UPI00271D218E|nr:TadE/TadG family type IV pilus assembly protein [Brevundimonas sp.]MDO9588942.1 pilus assembly protein [Brevundimonas sp.]MDP3370317.1 pilus assembly protein [Brevundimonas sp.]MDZ4108978.1 TadE/TadG family type IV pilus assembly protein [Brevundimonas sp.]
MSARAPRQPERNRAGFIRRLMDARDGATAVEFGMVAFPFCLMVFAILELALVFVIDSVLDNATIETGRLVRTGQASAQAMTAAEFKTSLCGRMSIFAPECAARATVDVREIPQFAVTPPDPMAGGTFDSGVLTYTNGVPGSLMVVRVWYRHPLITTFLAQGLSRLNDGTAMLTATTAFRNEPQ